jgi:hypothetical protein
MLRPYIRLKIHLKHHAPVQAWIPSLEKDTHLQQDIARVLRPGLPDHACHTIEIIFSPLLGKLEK